MRPTHPGGSAPREFRRRIERLERLPLRPTTVRRIIDAQPDSPGSDAAQICLLPQGRDPLELDPGWVLAQTESPSPHDPLALACEHAWWPEVSEAASAGLDRLWRHSVAVSCAARRLGQEAGERDLERLARTGLLLNLGLWAIAAIDPERLARLLAQTEPARRRELERAWLGVHAAELGRRLALCWGGDPLLIDATVLHDSQGLGLDACARDPGRLSLFQRAFQWAELTPWAHFPLPGRGPGRSDVRLQYLVAEVQARCGPRFVEPFTAREEQLTRSNARLRLRLTALHREQAATDRLLETMAQTEASPTLESWAERASQAWAGEPGVTQARLRPGSGEADNGSHMAPDTEPPDLILPMLAAGRQVAELHLWTERRSGRAVSVSRVAPTLWAAWGAWAAQIEEYDSLSRRCELAVEGLKCRGEQDDPSRRAERLDALAEFAAGAGHELNNPLAVIVGRAQLLLARQKDAESVRSLRAIISQAQRASRILRDLMYVARPPQPRPRPCLPLEIARTCARDFLPEAEDRGVRLVAESTDAVPPIWADPDPLRHLLETLLRNALEATPSGGLVRLQTRLESDRLCWTVEDTGRGFTPAELDHLFDPFFCGRQAGRGLGLGLPRIARFLELVAGDIRWRSAPGRGSIFHVSIPIGTAQTPGGCDLPTAGSRKPEAGGET